MTINPELLGHVLLTKGFEVWFRYLFDCIEGRPFIKEAIHDDLFTFFNAIYNGEKTRVNLNIPPRSGKTTAMQYFVVYCLTHNPSCNIIYTSYSQSLLTDIACKVASILENPIYKAMYPHRAILEKEEQNPINDFWKDYLIQETGKNTYSSRKITTYRGGVCLFSSIGSQITGYGCFSYDTLVLTENGFKKIGDIVEDKYNGKIWSYNFETKQKELQKIYDYVKNEKSDYLKLVLDNGEIINCTPDHIFYLKNGQEINANKLKIGSKIMSKSFDLGYRNVQFFSDFFSRMIFIKSKINLFLCKIIKIIIKFGSLFVPLKTKIFCYFSPNTTTFNITNRAIRQFIIFCYLFIWTLIFCNSNSNCFSNLMKFSVGFILIFHIFFSRAITKVFKSVIGRIRVKMSYLFCRFANKSKKHKSMNKQRPIATVFSQINSFVSFLGRILFHKVISSCRKNFTCFRNIISLIFGYREIVDIIDCKHKAPSYCITLWNNNNFYITKSQILVHNCGIRNSNKFGGLLVIDDAQKPADIRSEIMRENVVRYYEETLLSRLNNANVPIVNIQQRLHLDDLSGILERKYNYETLRKPLLDDKGVCQLPSQYTQERIEELKLNAYMFSAQYQQEPIPLGGNMIKSQWFNYYTEHPEYTKLFITADTAQKTKECNDFSVFMVWGGYENKLYLIDLIRGKWEAPDLLKQAEAIINKYRIFNERRLYEVLIEDKASGTGLIQTLKKTCKIPIKPIQVDKDKVTRVDDSLPFIANGYLMLPYNAEYGFNKDLINECELFARDMSHKHDDQVDNITMAIQYFSRKTSIYDVL